MAAAVSDGVALSRMTINNYMRQLSSVGYPLEKKHGKGYRLCDGLSLLDANALAEKIALPVEVQAIAVSTNDLARSWLSGNPTEQAAVFAAGYQTAGRGRMARTWQAEPCSSLLCSLAWRFERYPPDLAALSLVVGLALTEALMELGVERQQLGIKWPNDVLLNHKKLAGILIEANVQQDAVSVVIGLGVNLADFTKKDLRYPAASLSEAVNVAASDLLLLVIRHLQRLLADFSAAGFAGLHGRYMQHDVVVGRELKLDERELTVMDIDPTGALVVSEKGELQRYVSGELSLPWSSY